jgi:hypothetical protein
MTFKEFKTMFVDLTRVTVPHGSEYMYYHNYMRPVINFDCFQNGENFYHIVGDGTDKTLFCAHIDTACSISEPVKHGFDGHTIYSKSNTILGADDKAGVLALIYLIERKVPGTYYFFAGEECGRVGSTQASKDVSFFSKFDRAIQFDRRGYGSIITDQFKGTCCSDIFAGALASQFKTKSLKFEADPFGSYTDTASFMDIIPECTNISIGYFNEHSKSERQNINYAWQVAQAAADIDWDDLPVDRDPHNYGTNFSRFHTPRYLSPPVPPAIIIDSPPSIPPGTFGRGGSEYYPPKGSRYYKDPEEIPPFLSKEDEDKLDNFLSQADAERLEIHRRDDFEIEFDELLRPVVDGVAVSPPNVLT